MKRKPKQYIKNFLLHTHIPTVYALLIIVSCLLFFSQLLNLVLSQRILSAEQRIGLQSSPNYDCQFGGTLTKLREKYLKKYTVVKGDTLISIAKSQMGSESRVTELINLNRDIYPELSLSHPFVDVGMQFHIPPKDFPPSSGHLALVQGVVIPFQTNNNSNQITVKDNPSNYVGGIEIYPQPNTRYIGGENTYGVGECLEAVVDVVKPGINNIILIKPQ